MRSGVCPKCSATAVHAARGNFSWGAEQGVRIVTSPFVREHAASTPWGQVT